METRSKWLAILPLLILSAYCLQPQQVQAQEMREEPWQLIGVWNLDFSMSPKFDGPPPQARVLKYWLEGGNYHHTVHLIHADGKHTFGGWVVDSQQRPVPPSTQIVRRLDEYTSTIGGAQPGKPLTNLLTRIRWKDGKHMTFVRQRPDANGQLTVVAVETFTKQE